jgi:DHA1 family bicyclomycin/chloramphenicol resistance-like MFS transporter
MTGPARTDEGAPRAPGKTFAVVLATITMIGPLAIHFFLPVMPQVKAAFNVSGALAQVTFSITLATMAFMTLVYGALSDRYGRRPVLLSGLALFVCGSVLAAVASSIELLIAARLVQAAGAGCGVAMARAIARDAYGPDRLVTVIAYLTMAYTLGPMLAPPLGGVLGDHVGWRGVFWTAAVTGTAIAIGAALVLRETHRDRLVRASLASIPGDFLRLFGRLRFAAFVCQSGFSSGTFFTLAAGSTFLMQDYLGRSPSEYGLYFLLFPFGYCLGNFISTRLGGRVAIELMVMVGSVFIVASVIGQAGFLLAGIITPLVIFVPGFFLSVAQGIALPNAQAGAIRVVPELSGTAAGIGVFMQMICGAGFSQLYGLFADGTPWPMIAAMSLAATLTMIAGIAAWSTRPR